MTSLISFDEFKRKYPSSEYTKIGEGTYGKVYRYKDIAIKKSSMWKESTIREINMLCSVDNPNIIRPISMGYDRATKNVYIAMPLGTLIKDIKKYNLPDIIFGILCALYNLHNMDVAHCDIRNSNIVVVEDTPTLIDFGLAKETVTYNGDKLYQGIGYTVGFREPENLFDDNAWNSYKGDIWALGKTIVSWIEGEISYSSIPITKSRILFHMKKYISNEEATNLHDLISLMMKDHSERPSIEQLLKHPYLSSVKKDCIISNRIIPPVPPKPVVMINLNVKMWYILVDWIIDVHIKFESSVRTLFLTLHNMHRTSPMLLTLERNDLQLWGICHAYLASLMLETDTRDIWHYADITSKSYTEEQIEDMSWKLIQKMGGIISTPTLWDKAKNGSSLLLYLKYILSWEYDTLKVPIDTTSITDSKIITTYDLVGEWLYNEEDDYSIDVKIKLLKEDIRKDIEKGTMIHYPIYNARIPVNSLDFIDDYMNKFRKEGMWIDTDDLGFVYHSQTLLAKDMNVANEILHRLVNNRTHRGEDTYLPFDILFGRKLSLVGKNIRSLPINAYTSSYEDVRDLL